MFFKVGIGNPLSIRIPGKNLLLRKIIYFAKNGKFNILNKIYIFLTIFFIYSEETSTFLESIISVGIYIIVRSVPLDFPEWGGGFCPLEESLPHNNFVLNLSLNSLILPSKVIQNGVTGIIPSTLFIIFLMFSTDGKLTFSNIHDN